MSFNNHMRSALRQAALAAERGEVPVGAVVADPVSGRIVAAEGNRTRELNDPTAHAEMLAIRNAAASLETPRLIGLHLYVTLEPCAMCAAAIAEARLARIYYGASDPKSGGVEQGARVFEHPQCHHKPEVYPGIDEKASATILTEFFKGRRSH